MNNERIKTFSKQVWDLMTDDEKEHFYYDAGMTNFVGLTSKLLHLEPPTSTALYAVLDELTKEPISLDYIRDQIFDKAHELDDKDLSSLGGLLDEHIVHQDQKFNQITRQILEAVMTYEDDYDLYFERVKTILKEQK